MGFPSSESPNFQGSPYFEGLCHLSVTGRVWPPLVANFPELPSKASELQGPFLWLFPEIPAKASELQPGAAELLRTSSCGTSTKGTAGARTLATVALLKILEIYGKTHMLKQQTCFFFSEV